MSDVINGVPRELLERVLSVMDNYVTHETREEDQLRALLTAQPQASAAQSAPAGERETCSECNGLGFGPFGGCGECGGSGQSGAAPAQPAAQETCQTCNGVGIVGHSELCPECKGAPQPAAQELEK